MLSKACVVGQYQTKLEALAQHPNLKLTVIVPPFWRDERGVMPLERAHTRGYELIVAPLRFNGNFHWHYYPTLPQMLSRAQPDLVHIDEEPYNLATWLAMRAARQVGAKTLFFSWQNILRRYPPPFAWMERSVLRHADYAIVGNADAEHVLRAKHYRGPARVIPQFGVDPADFTVTPQRAARMFSIGYAGRLVPEKGVDLLLRAVAGLSGAWELHIVGSGPDLPRLQALARELQIEARVHFAAPLASVAMPMWYAPIDVFVLPSLTRANWKEQFGRVLIEAMACEIAVIGSTCGEVPHVLGDAGLIFPEGDVNALRAHLAALQSNLARRRELGERGRARVLAKFTQAHVADETYQVYCSVLGCTPTA